MSDIWIVFMVTGNGYTFDDVEQLGKLFYQLIIQVSLYGKDIYPIEMGAKS